MPTVRSSTRPRTKTRRRGSTTRLPTRMTWIATPPSTSSHVSRLLVVRVLPAARTGCTRPDEQARDAQAGGYRLEEGARFGLAAQGLFARQPNLLPRAAQEKGGE
eukprot:4558466-Prymnesium_polylepis.1